MKISEVDLQNQPLYELGQEVLRGSLSLEQALQRAGSPGVSELLDEDTIDEMDDYLRGLLDEQEQPELCRILAELNYSASRAVPASLFLQALCADVLEGALSGSLHKDLKRYISVLDRRAGICREAIHIWKELESEGMVASVRSTLGGILLARFEALGEVKDLDAAIESYKIAVGKAEAGSAEWATYRSNLGMAFETRYEALGRPEDLTAAVRLHKEALALTEDDSSLYASVQGNLGVAFNSRYDASGKLTDLDEAIKAYEKALSATDEDSPDWAGWQSNLGDALRQRFEMLGEMADLDAAIRAHKQALAATAESSANRAMYENNLGLALLDRFEALRELADLDAAITHYERALSLVPEKSVRWAGHQSNLGAALNTRFKVAGNRRDLSAAVEAHERSLSVTPEGTLRWANRTLNLANALSSRYGAFGTIGDLEAAVEAYEQALSTLPVGSVDWATCQNNLGVALRRRFDVRGEPADLDRAIRAHLRTLDAVQPGTVQEAKYRINLGIALHSRFETLGRVADLDAAIEAHRKASNIAPSGSLDWSAAQANLGTALRDRFELFGQTRDLETGIVAYRQGVRGAEEGGPLWAAGQDNLGVAYLARFEALGQMEDLDSAVASAEAAIRVARKGSPDWGLYQAHLGAALSRRFEALGRTRDLDRAVRCYRRALSTAPEGSLDRAMYQVNLGTVLSIRFDGLGEIQDLQEAVEVYKEALKVVPEGSLTHTTCLVNLGTALVRRSRSDGKEEDLDTAIVMLQRALRSTPRDSLDWAVCQANLGGAHRTRFSARDETADLNAAIEAYQQALEVFRPELFPDYTLSVSLPLGRLLLIRGQNGDFGHAVDVYHTAQPAADYLYFESLHQRRRQHQLGRVQGMSANHAYALAKSGDLREAVEVVEAGRAQSLTEALYVERASSVATELDQRNALEKAHSRVKEAENAYLHSHEGSREYLELKLANARRAYYDLLRDLFPDFFVRLTFSKIRQAAGGSSLVYLIVAPDGGLALIVPPLSEKPAPAGIPEVSAVWLADVTGKALRERMQGPDEDPVLGGYLGAYDEWRTARFDAAARRHWHAVLDETVRWLQRAIMSPVVASLEEQRCSRATLIPLGLLGLLPLHAVGDTDIRLAYSPNARALVAANDRANRRCPVSLVAVHNHDDGSEFSKAEVQAALWHFSEDRRLCLTGRRATSETVCEALRTYTVWHFSTHGWAGWQEPLDGGLLLANGERLTLRDILSLDVEARLAVLSGCETGIAGTDLPDEVVGLPTGLLQAGVAGVIGSLWAVDDFSTAVLMAQFYECWLNQGMDPVTALHEAQQWLCEVTNEELVSYFKQSLPEFGRHKLPKELADYGYKQSALGKANAQPLSHPFYWAGFYYAGA